MNYEWVLEYAPLVHRIISRIKWKLPAHLDEEDLFQSGIVGLLEAARSYDEKYRVKFSTFAQKRIKGAVLDYLRKMDPMPRNLRSTLKKIQNEADKLEQTLKRQITDEELINHLEMNKNEFYNLISEGARYDVFHLDDLIQKWGERYTENQIDKSEIRLSYEEPADQQFMRNQLIEALAQEIKSLSEKEKLIISFYYYEELTMKEIAAVLKITESRVCQVHGALLFRLKRRLKKLFN